MEEDGLHRRVTGLLFIKLRVEDDGAGLEIHPTHERRRFGRTVFAIHPAVFPFHRQRAGIADIVERDDDVLELDVTVAERAEIPIPARIGKRNMTAEHANCAVAVAPPDIFHVDVENPVAKHANEFHVTHALVAKV